PLEITPAKRIFNLAITNGDDRLWIAQAFVGTMARAGVKIETIVLDDRSSDAEVRKALDSAGKAEVIIVSMYDRVRTGQAGSGARPEPGLKALNELIDRKAPIGGNSFGNAH